MSNVERDIQRARADELLVAEWVLEHANETLWPFLREQKGIELEASLLPRKKGYNPDGDCPLKIETKTLLEVKVDYDGYQWDHVFVEYLSDGQPSGVMRSTALVVAHFVPPKHLLLYTPPRMASHIGWRLDAGYTPKPGGDRKAVDGMIIAIEELQDYDWVKYFIARIDVTGALRSYDDESQSTARCRPPSRNGPSRTGKQVSGQASGEAQDARGGPGRDLGRTRTGR